MSWSSVCNYDDLSPDRGVCALIGNEQVAIFRLASGEVFALANRDPFSGAYVLSRGIVGCRAGEPMVTSPMYKQAISLHTGISLDEPTVSVPTYPVQVQDGVVQVRVEVSAVA